MSKVTDTKHDAFQSRERLLATAHRLKHRVAPAALANDLLDVAQTKGRALALSAAQQPSRRPALAVALIIGGAGYLVRKPILTFLARILAKEPRRE